MLNISNIYLYIFLLINTLITINIYSTKIKIPGFNKNNLRTISASYLAKKIMKEKNFFEQLQQLPSDCIELIKKAIFNKYKIKILNKFNFAPREFKHNNTLTFLEFSPDNNYLLTAHSNGVAKLSDISTGNIIHEFNHTKSVLCAKFSLNNNYILTGSQDNTASLWDVNTGELIRQYVGHAGPIKSVAFSSNNNYILTASQDKIAKLWSINYNAPVCEFRAHNDTITTVLFSPNNNYILTASYDNSDNNIILWNLTCDNKTGKITSNIVRRFQGQNGDIKAACFSPDGKYLVTGSSDSSIVLWHVDTGLELRRLDSYKCAINSLAFSSNGLEVLAGYTDKSLRLYSLNTDDFKEFNKSAQIRGTSPVALSPNDKYIASTTTCFNVLLWPVEMDLNNITLHELVSLVD